MAGRKRLRGRQWVVVTLSLLIIGVLATWLVRRRPSASATHSTTAAPVQAPPDLAKLRERFDAGLDALQRGDSAAAIAQFNGFNFGHRAVEEYRLYFLANSYQLKGDADAARRTLALLWRRYPRFIYRHDVAFNIASLYANHGSWNEASDTYGTIAARSSDSSVAGEARWSYVEARLSAGDPLAALAAARRIVIDNPKSRPVGTAMALVRSLYALPATAAVPLDGEERVSRGEHLLADGDPQSAVGELTVLNASAFPYPLRQRILLTRGLALQALHRYNDSEAALAPLLADQFRFAIPALRASARNNQIVAASINPVGYKTITEKTKVGTVKVKVKGKTKPVLKPKYKITKKSVKVINTALQIRKESLERVYVEHLKDLLEMPTGAMIRKEVLGTLIAVAEAKSQDGYMRQLIPELVKLDRLADNGLQRFWDKAWAAYSAGDLATARELFTFISTTYTNPNIRRQSVYWLARLDERAGKKAEAAAAYQKLADSTYEDLYALFAEQRGAKRDRTRHVRLADAPDWNEVAERSMPAELRLSYELAALGANRESRMEAQDNANDGNRKWADAILAQLFHSEGNRDAGDRYLRRAYPEMATIEQINIPRQMIRLYYPLDYSAAIVKSAKKEGLDPYLVMALIRQESAFNPLVRSHVGATGLMQLMPATGLELARKLHKGGNPPLTDPQTNIELGTHYLKELIARVGGSQELALAAYNGGIGNVWKWQAAFRGKKPDEFIESIPFPETRGYVKRITMMRSTYEQLHDELGAPTHH